MHPTSVPPTLIYVGDPMCSWCWGYAPVLERLVSEHAVGFRLVLGGLRPGPAATTMDERARATILRHWEAVERMSGQPFDRRAFEARPRGWVYDTEPPSVAVAAVREMAPDLELEFFGRLQRAFYAEGVDITDPATHTTLIPDSVDPDEFTVAVTDPATRQRAWDDFAEARRLGVTGFPTTLLDLGHRVRMIAGGYQPFEQVDSVLHAALRGFAPVEDIGMVCSPDGTC